VRLKAARGEEMPVGWMIDREGKPLTDPKRVEEGTLVPIGDYKGSALSLIIGLLAGSLNGAAFGRELTELAKTPDAPANVGQSVVALSVEAFAPVAAFKRNVDVVIRNIREAQKRPGVERIWLPGEQSHSKRQDRHANGIPMPAGLRKSLDDLAKDLKIAPVM
jgi:LDH2 family malate/lactate/ureidoglycolate dehydrogenase